MTEAAPSRGILMIVALVAAVVGFLFAQLRGRPEEKPSEFPGDPLEKVAWVSLAVDSNNVVTGIKEVKTSDKESNGEILVLSESAREYGHWVTTPRTVEGKLEIVMKKESPFAADLLSFNTHVFSGPPRKGAHGQNPHDRTTYPYTVKFRPANGEPVTKDPPIRVDP